MIQQQQHFFDSKLNYNQQIESSDLSTSDKSILSIRNTSDLNNNDNYYLEKLHEKADMKQEPIVDALIDTKKQYQRAKKAQLKSLSNENTENSYGSDENESYQYQSSSFIPNKFYNQSEPQGQIYPWMKDSRNQNMSSFSPNSQSTVLTSPTITAISPHKNTTSQNFNQLSTKNEMANSTIHSIGSSSSPNASNPSESLLITPSAGAKSTSKSFLTAKINRANLKVISNDHIQ